MKLSELRRIVVTLRQSGYKQYNHMKAYGKDFKLGNYRYINYISHTEILSIRGDLVKFLQYLDSKAAEKLKQKIWDDYEK